MNDLQSIADEIADLKGHLLALECVVDALVLRLPRPAGVVLEALHATERFAYSRSLAASGVSRSLSGFPVFRKLMAAETMAAVQAQGRRR